jgi:hypothetical protein
MLSQQSAAPMHLPQNRDFVSRGTPERYIALAGRMWQGNGPQAQPLACVRRFTSPSIGYLVKLPASHPSRMSEGITHAWVARMYSPCVLCSILYLMKASPWSMLIRSVYRLNISLYTASVRLPNLPHPSLHRSFLLKILLTFRRYGKPKINAR